MGRAGRLKSFAKLLAHMRDVLQIDLGFVLWDDVTVPGDLAPDAFAVIIADEGAVAAMIRRPKMETLLNLWVSKRIDLRNGDLFDLVRNKPGVRTREIRKAVNKWLAFNTARKFWFVDRGEPVSLKQEKDGKPSDGSEDENRKNIQYHYDLSNAFYALWLDREMVYSCGYCTDWDNDIHRMQIDKLELICRKLRLQPGESLLDIGCGWGALSCYAAEKYGVNVLGVTLSTQQIEHARKKASQLGLDDRVTFELVDYTALKGAFDKIVSIGMHEHVGMDNYPTYYSTVRRLLKPDGLYLHHAITRPMKQDMKTFRRRNEETELMTKYIFPGGELDHIGNTVMNLEQFGFEIHDVENLREHYQRTCKRWHDRLLENYDAAAAEAGESTTRLWLVYLAGSSIQFERNGFRLFQTLASHKRRGPSGLPPTRADLYR